MERFFQDQQHWSLCIVACLLEICSLMARSTEPSGQFHKVTEQRKHQLQVKNYPLDFVGIVYRVGLFCTVPTLLMCAANPKTALERHYLRGGKTPEMTLASTSGGPAGRQRSASLRGYCLIVAEFWKCRTEELRPRWGSSPKKTELELNI